jgi:hypothetical protein
MRVCAPVPQVEEEDFNISAPHMCARIGAWDATAGVL